MDDLALIGPRSSRIATVVVVALLAAAGSTAGLYFGLRGAPRHRVPALVGFSLEHARGMAQKRGLGLVVSGYRPDALVAEGSVASQDPLARRRLAEGRPIVVEISSGPPKARSRAAVPASAPPTAAAPAMAAVPKTPAVPTPPTPRLPAPPAVKRPPVAPAEGPVAGQVTVPKVTGVALRYARSRLQGAGLVLGNVRYKVDEDHMDKMVLGQQPSAGARVARGSRVDLVINRYD